MNILYVLHERNLGGGSKSAITLIEELRQKGHNVKVIVPLKRGMAYKKLVEKGIPVKVIFFAWWMMPNYWNWWMKCAFSMLYLLEPVAVWRISRFARKNKVQIIHSNSSVIDVGGRAAQKIGIPHVWHVREYGDSDFRLQFIRGRRKSCDFMNQVPGVILFISNSLRNHYASDIRDDVCKVVYNGLPEEYLTYHEKNRKQNERITFLISGNLHRNKRQDLAIKACRILEEKGHDDFRLIIAGAPAALKDSRDYETELKNSAKLLKEGRVEFTGFVSDMNSLRERADVELVCSSKEAFGRVTVEAMLAGNAVIASDSGASPELIEEKKNGWLFAAGDAESLAECMENALTEKKTVYSMGTYAREFALNNFSSAKNTDSIEKQYCDLLGVDVKLYK